MEATHLTRAGRLVEATVLMKRMLQHGSAANENDDRRASYCDRGQANGLTGLEFSTGAEPASRLTRLSTTVADRVGQRFDVIRSYRGQSARECSIAVPRPQLKEVDERPGQFVTGSYANSMAHASTSSTFRQPTPVNRFLWL